VIGWPGRDDDGLDDAAHSISSLGPAFCSVERLGSAPTSPVRYRTGNLGDLGVPRDLNPMDFNAWFKRISGTAGLRTMPATGGLVSAALSWLKAAPQSMSPS
jgi:hypothetical protein